MSLIVPPSSELVQCGRCEGYRYPHAVVDDICTTCIREVGQWALCADQEDDDTMPISPAMYYDYIRAHFDRALKNDPRKTRLVLVPFTVEAMLKLR